VESPVRVKTRGGEDLLIHVFDGEDGAGDVWLEGSTSVIYRGELKEEAL